MKQSWCHWVLAGVLISFCQFAQVSVHAADKALAPAKLESGAAAAGRAVQSGSLKSGSNAPVEEIPDWQARLELARLLSYVKRYDESLAEYQKVLKEKPDLVDAQLEMAAVLYWSGHVGEALNLLEQTPPEQLNPDSRLLLADIYVTQKRYNLAEPIYREHLQKHPDDLAVRLKLAELLGYMKDYPQSIEEYQLILKARPDDIQVRRQYAMVLSWAGRHAEAIAELRKTLDR